MLGAYILAGGAAYTCMVTMEGIALWKAILIADIVGTAIIFGFSLMLNNSSMYDPYWSVIPPLIALYLIWQPGQQGADIFRQLLVTNLVIVWGGRLTFNFIRSWGGGLKQEDWRYVDLRKKTGKFYWLVSFTGIHLFPTLLVYLGCLSLIPALSLDAHPFNWLDGLALIVTAGAIWLEATADRQLHNFVLRNKHKGGIIDTGLWRFSRHPNYLGEMLFWWGLFLFALAARPDYWWCIVGPLSITLLFNFISIPMLDKRSLERRPGYAEHMKNVPALIPRRPKKKADK